MILKTNRTIISPLQARDIPYILKMYKEVDSFKYINPLKDKSLDFYTDFLLKKIEKNKTELGFWVVTDTSNNEVIGTVNLNKFFDTEMTQVGCHLGRKFWNQGYAFELLEEIVRYGVTDKKLTDIYGIFQKDNQASQRLMEKLNFTPFEERVIANTDVNIYKLEITH